MEEDSINHQFSIFEPREDVWMMESLNDFFDSCEKEYSQQVMIPESEVLQEPCIKKGKYFLDTEQLKENSRLNAERARERFSRLLSKLRRKKNANMNSKSEK